MTPYPEKSAAELSPLLQGSDKEVRLQVGPDSFFRLFTQLNQLDTINHFLFQPGMLFNDSLQWWGLKERRPRPHEGIDIFLMQSSDMLTSSVLPQMLIPAILPGYLVHFHRDFLGETLYIQHPYIREKGAVLHTLYGHTRLISGSSCPSYINKGQIVGAIHSPPVTSSVPAHLHVSCAWIREDQLMEELNWESMSAGDQVTFIDPLFFLLQ